MIYKYTLELERAQNINLNKGYKILDVQVQTNSELQKKIVIWANVDLQNELIPVTFFIYGTGSDALIYGTYVGTVQLDGFVWHIYQQERNTA